MLTIAARYDQLANEAITPEIPRAKFATAKGSSRGLDCQFVACGVNYYNKKLCCVKSQIPPMPMTKNNIQLKKRRLKFAGIISANKIANPHIKSGKLLVMKLAV